MKYLIFMLLSISCYAQDDLIVNFNPSGNLTLGRSIDINNPSQSKQEAITYQPPIWIDGGSPSTMLKASLATNIDELYQKLNLDFNTQGEAKIPVIGSGKAEFDLKYEIERNYNDNNLYYVIQAYNDFGRQALPDVKLKEEFKKLLDTKKYDQFIQSVGTHFVGMQRRASNIYAIITISKLNIMTKKSLNITYNTSINFNINKVVDISAQQTLQYKNFIKNATQMASVKIEYYSSGTEGLSKLAATFPQSPDDLGVILKALAEATSTVTRDNSTPIEYHLMSFQPFGLKSPPFDKVKGECLSKYANKKVMLNSYINKLRQTVIDNATNSFNNYYLNKINELTNTLNVIEKQELDCRDKGNCCQNDIKIESIAWLEDIIAIENTSVSPTYIPVYNLDGTKVGKILKTVKLIVVGKIQNDEYYCCMGGNYLDDNFNPVKIDIKFVGNTNPSLSDPPVKNGEFSKRRFFYVIDMVNIDYESNTNGNVLYSKVNLDKSQAIVDKLRRNNYFIEVASKNFLKFFYDIRSFDFNEIQTLVKD